MTRPLPSGRDANFLLQSVAAAASGKTTASREKVLLVEDEAFVRHVVCEVLGMAGYCVLKARDASEAMQLVEQEGQGVRLLVTDVVLPGASGCALAGNLANLCPGLRAIFISGYPEAALPKQGPNGHYYLAKPFSAESLLRIVRTALEEPGSS